MLQTYEHAKKIEGRFRWSGSDPLAKQAKGLPEMVDQTVQEKNGRVCTACHEWKLFSEFFSRSTRRVDGGRKYKPRCKSCTAAQAKMNRMTNGERIRAQERASWRRRFHINGHSKRVCSLDWRLRTRFGLTLSEYMDLLVQQNYGCAICRAELQAVSAQRDRERSACVDHDHATNKVRGLLCNPCNLAIGYLKDSPANADALAAYLRKHVHG